MVDKVGKLIDIGKVGEPKGDWFSEHIDRIVGYTCLSATILTEKDLRKIYLFFNDKDKIKLRHKLVIYNQQLNYYCYLFLIMNIVNTFYDFFLIILTKENTF